MVIVVSRFKPQFVIFGIPVIFITFVILAVSAVYKHHFRSSSFLNAIEATSI